MINCRKIGAKDFNVFESFFHNFYFIFFWFLIGGVQFVGTNYFSFIFRTVPMSRTEWGSCIVIGSTVLLWAALLKFLPDRWFKCLENNKIIDEDKKTDSFIVKKLDEKKKEMKTKKDEPTVIDEGSNVEDGDDHYEAA